MKLFHGTCATLVPVVLEQGLRSRRKRKGNWSQYPSRPDMVYLTAGYACYYGHYAAKKNGIVVFEVDLERLDKDLLHPDEDFIAQAIAHQRGEELKKVHGEVRRTLTDYQHHWLDSIQGLGNACYRGVIQPQAITRYAVMQQGACRDFQMAALDPCISVVNYRFMGSKYQSMMGWLFGDRPDWEVGFTGMSNADYVKQCEQWKVAVPNLDEIFSNRSGIEVVTL